MKQLLHNDASSYIDMEMQFLTKLSLAVPEVIKNITSCVPFTNISFYTALEQAMHCELSLSRCQGAVSIRKTVLPGMAIPMLKIRRPNGRLIFNMEITIRR